jgi:hypothetical protein
MRQASRACIGDEVSVALQLGLRAQSCLAQQSCTAKENRPRHFGREHLALLLLVLTAAFPSAGQTFQIIDPPGSVQTSLAAINDSNVAVGYYKDGKTGNAHGLIYANGNFTTVDYPGVATPGIATGTLFIGINNAGQILGYQTGFAALSYFIYSNGNFSTIDLTGLLAPSKTSGVTLASIQGFNDLGQIVATVRNIGGFGVYGTPAFTTTPASSSPALYTQLPTGMTGNAINSLGQIAGTCGLMACQYNVHVTGSAPASFSYPGADITIARAISNAGTIAGTYELAGSTLPTPQYGFVYDGAAFTKLVAPNSTSTAPLGVNINGYIVGQFTQANTGVAQIIHAFIVGAPSTPPAQTPQITLVDPVPQFLSGPQITSALTAASALPGQPYLADLTKGRTVKGLATDGVAQVVIQIPATSVGQQITIDFAPGTCAAHGSPQCIDEYGYIFDPITFDPTQSGSLFSDTLPQRPVVVNAVATANGPVAFAAYRAPADFVRPDSPTADDQEAAQRSVSITINGVAVAQNIVLVRPPVILIHGIFSDPSVFDNFTPILNKNGIFYINTLDYSDDIDAQVKSAVPAEIRTSAHIRRNVVGVEYNAPLLLDEMVSEIDDFKMDGMVPIAAVQADIVAHSLGGLMARGMAHVGTDFPLAETQTSFDDDESYGVGYIHKLITLGTPHLGTNLALRLVNGDKIPNVPTFGALFPSIGGNDCTRKNAGIFGEYNFNSVTINNTIYNGASFDLYGDPTQAIISPMIALLNQPTFTPIRTAFVAGSFTADNNSSFITTNGLVAKWACGTQTVSQTPTGPSWMLGAQHCATCVVHDGDFLADNYSFVDWPNIFNAQLSDVAVPFTSATFNQPVFSSFPQGLVHGPGSVGLGGTDGPHLGFAGPQLLDPAGPVPAMALQLLNTSVKDISKFVNMP